MGGTKRGEGKEKEGERKRGVREREQKKRRGINSTRVGGGLSKSM